LDQDGFDELLHEYTVEPDDEEYPEAEAEVMEGMSESSLRVFNEEMGKESKIEITPRKCCLFNFNLL
jgi:hypothetical protein